MHHNYTYLYMYYDNKHTNFTQYKYGMHTNFTHVTQN